MSDRLQPLRTQLGDPLPDALSELGDEELADLAAAVTEAHSAQSLALDRAIDHTLRYLPWPISGIVRKVLIG